MTLTIDAQFRRIGGETKLVLQGSIAKPPPGSADPMLPQALAQAHTWSEMNCEDPTLPTAYFASRARVSETYAARILKLAFLAQDIIEAILAGKQPRSLTLKRVLRGIPLSWSEQRERFGIGQAWFSP